ncbi:type III-B CRISPR module-associated protein Cmr5 [Marichromatium gracile]|uniref:CRISPR type III-B/RAMP module-associated protein Cmr5 n=1 Tax=Marichromatium gracile TaxID=1048 RepID=A0ABR5VK69_MARGR|nr:type III-B CRISPR module-associated protein Cmr5 [Marichromatium gracile]KXX64817.1 type III-B CRISPR module-associated protein Cmr5 [Marichromatium gracile]
MTMQMRAQRLAMAAYSCVDHIGGGIDGVDPKRYGAIVHRLPGMILQHGLAQSSGFLLAKGTAEHLRVLDDLCRVLREAGVTKADNGVALHHGFITADLTDTMALTRHALDAAAWLKRYVQGVLRITATGDTASEERRNHESD